MESHGLVCTQLLPRRDSGSIYTGPDCRQRHLGWRVGLAIPRIDKWRILRGYRAMLSALAYTLVEPRGLRVLLCHCYLDSQVLDFLPSHPPVEDHGPSFVSLRDDPPVQQNEGKN